MRFLLPILTFLAGAALAFGLTFYLNPPAERLTLQKSVASLTETVNAQKDSLAKTEQELTATKLAKATLQTDLTREKEKAAQIAAAPAPAAKPSAMEDAMAQAMAAHTQSRIDSLTLALHLTPDQIARLKQVAANAQPSTSAGGFPISKSSAAYIAISKELDAMLTPEQKTDYEAFKTKEKNSQVEMMANMETSQLQSALNLSPEQSDQVFKKLAEVQQQQYQPAPATPGVPPSTDPAQILQAMSNRKKEALRGTLTEEQFKAYEQFLNKQNEMALKMMPAMKAAP